MHDDTNHNFKANGKHSLFDGDRELEADGDFRSVLTQSVVRMVPCYAALSPIRWESPEIGMSTRVPEQDEETIPRKWVNLMNDRLLRAVVDAARLHATKCFLRRGPRRSRGKEQPTGVQ